MKEADYFDKIVSNFSILLKLPSHNQFYCAILLNDTIRILLNGTLRILFMMYHEEMNL